jgi:hypothetical protein
MTTAQVVVLHFAARRARHIIELPVQKSRVPVIGAARTAISSSPGGLGFHCLDGQV